MFITNTRIINTLLHISSLLLISSISYAGKVNITKDIDFIEVDIAGKTVKVERNQDTSAVIDPGYAKTSRPCPPFCAQPIIAAEGVKTIGEMEVAQFMNGKLKGGRGILVDARTTKWYEKGTIPGSINVPFTHVSRVSGADDFTIADALEKFGAVQKGDDWDFSNVKYLVLWCNGPWCGQSPVAIRGLLNLGYPAEKLYYYRGGMQLWKIFGLNVVVPK